jgi:transcriptional regulator with XRE-family HTH domain
MIGEKIKTLRKEHNLTQVELAKKLGVDQPLLHRWENGGRNPSLKTIKKISKIFTVSIDTLVFDEKDIKHLTENDKPLLEKLKNFEKLKINEQEMIINMINTLVNK